MFGGMLRALTAHSVTVLRGRLVVVEVDGLPLPLQYTLFFTTRQLDAVVQVLLAHFRIRTTWYFF